MNIKSVTALEAQKIILRGAKLIDIRERSEYLREHISSAISLPITEILEGKKIVETKHKPIIFYCLSGVRTRKNKDLLIQAANPSPIFMLEGGINAWKRSGLSVIHDKKQPLPIMRQVQVIAGTLIIMGVILGYTVNIQLFLISGFVGAGLVFSGLSGLCGMANLLLKMPWNRPR